MSLDINLRIRCFIRDGWKCRHCRSTYGLHAHHLEYASQGGPDELQNLCTLCWQCHRAHHDKFLDIEVIAKLANDNEIKFTKLRGWKPR